MNTELEIVREYLSDIEVPTKDLSVARAMLEDVMSTETEVAAGAGFGAEVRAFETPVRYAPRRNRTRSHARLRWLIAAAAAAAAIAVILFQIVPSAKVPAPEAAAAEIARLADAVQPPPPLQPGQWYRYQLQGVLTANVSTSGSTVTAEATANIPISVGEWSNSTGATCTLQQFGTATFATPADAQAWQAMGLIDSPSNQPVTGCSAGLEAVAGAGLSSSVPPIDVSSITHDPGALAAQLQGQRTGIPAVDGYARGEPPNVAGFLRLTELLVGPVKGQWSGFGQEMLRTMALLPGVVSLGGMTSHSGASGLAFSTRPVATLNPKNGAQLSSFTPPTVILDAQSGTLLEVRNFDFPVLQSAAQDFVGSSTAPVYSQGVGYGVTAAWIDPVSALGVVEPSALPVWIGTFHVIEAVTNASATEAQVSAVVNPFLGNGNMAFTSDNTPASGQTTYDITVMGTVANEQFMASALTASGLFASVSVKL
jgi:hypothetical protein